MNAIEKVDFCTFEARFYYEFAFPIQSCRNISCMWYIIIALNVLSTSLFNFSDVPMVSVRFFDYIENEISVPKVLGVSIHSPPSLFPILSGMEHCNSCDAIHSWYRVALANIDRKPVKYSFVRPAWYITPTWCKRCTSSRRQTEKQTRAHRVSSHLPAIGLVASVAGMSSPALLGHPLYTQN